MRYSPVEIRRHLSGQERSGLPVRTYCTRNNLNYWTFRGWRKRIADSESATPLPFVKISLPEQPSNLPSVSVLEITTGTNAIIRLPGDMNPATARKLLSAIKRSGIV